MTLIGFVYNLTDIVLANYDSSTGLMSIGQPDFYTELLGEISIITDTLN